MKKEAEAQEASDRQHLGSLIDSLIMYKSVKDLEPTLDEGECVGLINNNCAGRFMEADETFMKILEGYIQGDAAELVRDGYGKEVRKIFRQAEEYVVFEREKNGE